MFDFNKITPLRQPDTPKTPAELAEDFRAAMARHGITCTGPIHGDGKLHRFSGVDKKDKAEWYVLHSEHAKFMAGAFGSWRLDISENWCSKAPGDMSSADQAEYTRYIEKITQERHQEQKRLHDGARRDANIRWAEMESVSVNPDHPYLKAKHVGAYGIRVDPLGRLMIPVCDLMGDIHSLQFIPAQGKKMFLRYGAIDGHSFTIPGKQDNLYICEGYATGATIHEATGATVVIAFNVGNLAPVSKMIRTKYPTTALTICADNDQWTKNNPGLTKAQAAAKNVGAVCIYPEFKDLSTKPTDFNDLASLEGLDRVRGMLTDEKKQYDGFAPLKPEDTQVRILVSPPDIKYLACIGDKPFLPRGIVGCILAQGSTGKTQFGLQLLYAGSMGTSLGPIKFPEPTRCLGLLAEDPWEIIQHRLWNIGHGEYADGFHIYSTLGKVGPLMELNQGNPVRSKWFSWLDETIGNHAGASLNGIPLVFIDPKSRAYGLDENNNDHATQFVASLELLSQKHNTTIIFAHHVSKARASTMDQSMSRGASALVDACRFVAGMTQMPPETAKRYEIENPRDYIAFDVVKNNYAPRMSSPFYFKRGPDGVFQYVSLEAKRLKEMTAFLCGALMDERCNGIYFTRRELRREKKAKMFCDEIKSEFPDFTRKNDIDALLDFGIKNGWIAEEPVNDPGEHQGRKIITVVKHPNDANLGTARNDFNN